MKKLKELNLKSHLLTAIPYLILIVCDTDFLIIISMGSDGSSRRTLVPDRSSLWDALAAMDDTGLGLLPVAISTGTSPSIVGKPGIAPGFIVSLAANTVGTGFVGGTLGGYLAGYLVLAILEYVELLNWVRGLMPTLITLFLTSITGGLIMACIVGTPVTAFTSLLTNLLDSLGNSLLLIFGGVIGLLSGIDYGRPINKIVFAFVLTMRAGGFNEPITALQLVNTATPIDSGLTFFSAKLFRRNIYTESEVETLKSTVPVGAINIVEGAILLVMNDIIRGVIVTAIGDFVGGATTMVLGASATVPFGGVLMIPIMGKLLAGTVAIAVNTVVTGLVLAITKKDVAGKDVEALVEKEEEGISLENVQIL